MKDRLSYKNFRAGGGLSTFTAEFIRDIVPFGAGASGLGYIAGELTSASDLFPSTTHPEPYMEHGVEYAKYALAIGAAAAVLRAYRRTVNTGARKLRGEEVDIYQLKDMSRAISHNTRRAWDHISHLPGDIKAAGSEAIANLVFVPALAIPAGVGDFILEPILRSQLDLSTSPPAALFAAGVGGLLGLMSAIEVSAQGPRKERRQALRRSRASSTTITT